MALFKTFRMQNVDLVHFLEVFQKSEILKNAVSGIDRKKNHWPLLCIFQGIFQGKES